MKFTLTTQEYQVLYEEFYNPRVANDFYLRESISHPEDSGDSPPPEIVKQLVSLFLVTESMDMGDDLRKDIENLPTSDELEKSSKKGTWVITLMTAVADAVVSGPGVAAFFADDLPIEIKEAAAEYKKIIASNKISGGDPIKLKAKKLFTIIAGFLKVVKISMIKVSLYAVYSLIAVIMAALQTFIFYALSLGALGFLTVMSGQSITVGIKVFSLIIGGFFSLFSSMFVLNDIRKCREASKKLGAGGKLFFNSMSGMLEKIRKEVDDEDARQEADEAIVSMNRFMDIARRQIPKMEEEANALQEQTT